MQGVMRPSRGRPNKVSKPSVPATPRGRVGRTSNLGQHMSPPEHKATEYPEGMLSDLNAAAAAAAATAVMTAAGMNSGGDMHDAEADAEMEDDDQDTGLHTQHHNHSHTDHMDLNTAANILANGGNGALPSGNGLQLDDQQQQQHHHQQQQMQAHHQQQQAQQQHHQPMSMPDQGNLDGSHGFNTTSLVKTTEDMARDSGYGTLNVESALAKRLAKDPGLRIAHQRRPDQALNLQRRSNVEALFAHIAGQLAPTQCKNCHKGHGPWTSCVVVEGQMCGSCANCWFNASGARCSFHETRNPSSHQPGGLLGTTGASLPPSDPAAAYAISAQHHPNPNAHMALPAAAAAGNPTLASLGVGNNDPVVRYTVDRAMAEVRNADRKTRQIMKIEIAAKQLALQIVEYEETSVVSSNHVGQQQQQGLGGGGDPAS